MLPDKVSVLSLEEVVFNCTTDRCEDDDIADAPADAFRDATSNTQVIASHLTNQR